MPSLTSRDLVAKTVRNTHLRAWYVPCTPPSPLPLTLTSPFSRPPLSVSCMLCGESRHSSLPRVPFVPPIPLQVNGGCDEEGVQKQCPHATPSHLPGGYPCPFPIRHVWSACVNRDTSDSWVVGRRAEWRGVPPLSRDRFCANDRAQQERQSRLGYAWYASCSIRGQAFPHPPHVGFVPPRLSAQARSQSDARKVRCLSL